MDVLDFLFNMSNIISPAFRGSLLVALCEDSLEVAVREEKEDKDAEDGRMEKGSAVDGR
tara:strand:+ start:248 stop:424 length:177 start_codon:yes stop_codon:yes gene_type:complete